MGRIRTIKPDFFLHFELYLLEKELALPIRVSFAGLWTCADREGRFPWKPEMLKTQIIPYDNADFAAILDALASKGFIEKYSVEGKDYGLVPSWLHHQIINNREAESKIPPPFVITMTRGEDAVTREGNCIDAPSGERKGKEGKGREHASLDASVASRVLSERVGNMDLRFQEQLCRMIKAVCRADESLEACVDRMAGQWDKYNAGRSDLNYPVSSSRKFFESGTWHDEKLWPWKEGKQPNEAKPMTAAEKMRRIA